MLPSEKETILSSIRALGAKVLPKGARLILFGSQARNDARDDSDWDLLILLNDKQLQKDAFGAFAYPFVELGWEYGTYFIHPRQRRCAAADQQLCTHAFASSRS